MSRFFEAYATQEMYEAIHALWNEPPDVFDTYPKRQNQRRIVSHFWQRVATLARKRLIDKNLVLETYGPAIEIWQKLKPLEERIALRIMVRDHPSRKEDENLLEVRQSLDSSDLEWLYNEWMKKKFPIRRGVISRFFQNVRQFIP